jgi:MoxR-like ATPase
MSTIDPIDEILDILSEREASKSEVPDPMREDREPEPEALVATEWEEIEGGKHRKVPFVDLFGWVPTTVPNHLVSVFEGFNAPPKLDIYVPPIEAFESYSLAISLGLKLNVVGPTGAGKTMMQEWYASMTGRPYLRIEHNASFDKTEVFGQVHITDGDTDFKQGVLPKSMPVPTLVLLDELTRNTGYANMVYQRLLDRMELSLPELKDTDMSILTPSPHWVVCATDNTKGNGDDMEKYPMSNVQDSAFINRWDMIIEQDYMTVKEEEKLIKALLPSMTSANTAKLAQFSKLIHMGYKRGNIMTAYSPRNLVATCKLVGAGVKIKQAIEMNYVSRVSKSEASDVIECLTTAFGK